MAIVISCNIPNGVILGTSCNQVTYPTKSYTKNSQVQDQGNKHKSVKNLFGLRDKPIGIATYSLTYGLDYLDESSVASYIHQFDDDFEYLSGKDISIKSVSNRLLSFFDLQYDITQVVGHKDDDQTLILGIVVAGFSDQEFLGEVRHIEFFHNKISITDMRSQKSFGINFFGTSEEVKQAQDVSKELIQKNSQYQAMSIKAGIDHVSSLIEQYIKHTGSGELKLGFVTADDESFRILD